MFAVSSASWYHCPQYSAESRCDHCGGVVRHERWCITHNPAVHYAFDIVRDAEQLTLADRLSLHGLGVAWVSDGLRVPEQIPGCETAAGSAVV
ncbi:MAG TPA: hypothetical protein VKV39_18010 [Candidatus Sulfotelmatobacter sp.]|nr:hypothetical protein [Candidatus Sulfotelmatobacter sp.]